MEFHDLLGVRTGGGARQTRAGPLTGTPRQPPGPSTATPYARTPAPPAPGHRRSLRPDTDAPYARTSVPGAPGTEHRCPQRPGAEEGRPAGSRRHPGAAARQPQPALHDSTENPTNPLAALHNPDGELAKHWQRPTTRLTSSPSTGSAPQPGQGACQPLAAPHNPDGIRVKAGYFTAEMPQGVFRTRSVPAGSRQATGPDISTPRTFRPKPEVEASPRSQPSPGTAPARLRRLFSYSRWTRPAFRLTGNGYPQAAY
ncbi:hypothetical protein SAMN05216275_1452 [Streptosporangium canum]|uniref:Uncharacterized protein n=1 Tax=Streptosporangium canum TaxID=324952 RepID=A0A1I4DX94_9ACTN|nr:hypothetical protein SAMN05216275_1452 [Streptosporangium canum]